MSEAKKSGSGGTATSRLDAVLDERLDQTLDESTKFELRAYDAIDRLITSEADTPEAAGMADLEESAGYDAPPPFDLAACKEVEDEVEEAKPVILARVRFEDGDYFEFSAIPHDGEMTLAFQGDDLRRSNAAFDELMSPLRLYCSLAPREAGVPWLIAAVDRQPDRAALVAGRTLCDSVGTVPSASNIVRLKVPGVPGGMWTPDFYGMGGTCGVLGHDQWLNFFGPMGYDNNPPNLFGKIEHSFSTPNPLTDYIVLQSTVAGKWRRRKVTFSAVAPCNAACHVQHQYRKWQAFVGWTWVTEKSFVHLQANTAKWLYSFSAARRRRRNIFENVPNPNFDAPYGLRVYSNFKANFFQ